MDGPSTPPASDEHWPLKGRIVRCHNRLKEARAAGEKPDVLDALAAEMNKVLEELHDRLTTAQLENMYSDE